MSGVGRSGDEPVFFQAGATVARGPAEAFWGGYTSIVFDPDGDPWEFAHNPGWLLTEDGGVRLG